MFGGEKEGLWEEGTGDGPCPVNTAIHSGQEGTGLLQLKAKSLNPWTLVRGRGTDLKVGPEQAGGRLPGYEGGRYDINDASADMKAFILTADPIAPIRARKPGIHGKKPSPIFNIVL